MSLLTQKTRFDSHVGLSCLQLSPYGFATYREFLTVDFAILLANTMVSTTDSVVD